MFRVLRGGADCLPWSTSASGSSDCSIPCALSRIVSATVEARPVNAPCTSEESWRSCALALAEAAARVRSTSAASCLSEVPTVADASVSFCSTSPALSRSVELIAPDTRVSSCSASLASCRSVEPTVTRHARQGLLDIARFLLERAGDGRRHARQGLLDLARVLLERAGDRRRHARQGPLDVARVLLERAGDASTTRSSRSARPRSRPA